MSTTVHREGPARDIPRIPRLCRTVRPAELIGPLVIPVANALAAAAFLVENGVALLPNTLCGTLIDRRV